MNMFSSRALVAHKFGLALCGLLASGIAITIIVAPETFYAANGIDLSGNTSLTNELKAPAGLLLAVGLLMFAGVFRTQLIPISLTAAAVVYLAYGLSRSISIAVDGVPGSGLVGAAILEIAIGVACLFFLMRGYKPRNAHTST